MEFTILFVRFLLEFGVDIENVNQRIETVVNYVSKHPDCLMLSGYVITIDVLFCHLCAGLNASIV